MNIIEAVKQMTPKKMLVSEDGYVAVIDDEGRIMTPEGESFWFFVEEILSDNWTVEEDTNEPAN
jgi:hypothetical protein